MLKEIRGINLPISGFIEAAKRGQNKKLSVAPLSWCSAEPSSYVTSAAFDHVTLSLCTLIKPMMDNSDTQLIAVYLDLHGAMVTENYDDGEAEILRRIRSVVGREMPIVISLDWHANLSEEVHKLATGITVYRTYPHVDMANTGARCFKLLENILVQKNRRIPKSFRRVPYLIPITAQYDAVEPSLSLCSKIKSICQDGTIISADFSQGKYFL